MSLLKHKFWPSAGTLGVLTATCIVLLVGLADRAVAAAPPSKKSAPAAKATENDRPAAASDSEDAGDLPENPFPKRFKAPELEGGAGWLNTSGEITMKDLRGKVVLLDFWTFCCINCMHVLPDLAYLEKKYDKQLVVIGVHSAKFSNEKETENIRRAIARYEIAHPVINDSDMVVWRKFEEFGVRGWPSIVLIDPEGFAFGSISGEGNREILDKVIERVVAYHRAKRTLDETPIRFDLERNKMQPTPLRFPGKILADAAGGRLFISDSNHNRIVIASLEGKLLATIGTGAIGKADGAFEKSSFDHPQGMALVGERLYVADTENHLLREIDLNAKTVGTLAGTGKQGHERRGGALLATPLNSPWDLAHVDGRLYVAMAGPHQIWVVDLAERKSIKVYAGSGKEDIVNGPLEFAALAQPSGIATDGKFLYVADSEGSAIRRVPLDAGEEISTIVGTSDLPRGRSLFEFGDRDGTGSAARLQHPLGIAWSEGLLYVADSYNHKIKEVDPAQDKARTLLGDGRSGDRDDPPRFFEPGGLSIAGETLYVADTNNHRIRKVDLKSGKVATLEIAGLEPPPALKPDAPEENDPHKPIKVAAQRVAAGQQLEFEAVLTLPEGYKLNPLAPITYRLAAGGEQSLVAAQSLGERNEIEFPAEGTTVRFAVPLASKTGKGELKLAVSYGYCRDGAGGLCKLGTLTWLLPIEVAADAKQSVIKLTSARE
jgi:sugar lactone lactonase YvrE/thiol-disulfide isomerase/thioredoxin